jgi:hypothetical protein
MAGTPFAWDNLGTYKADGRFLDGYPDDQRTFFAPGDDTHGLLVALLDSAQRSIVLSMSGGNDHELNNIVQDKLADEKVYVQMSLYRTYVPGAAEKQILTRWANDAAGNSIAIGTSSPHNAVAHLRVVIVDGVYTVKAPVYWSLSRGQQQDCELSLSRNAVIAAETRAFLDIDHDFMLKQMVRTTSPLIGMAVCQRRAFVVSEEVSQAALICLPFTGGRRRSRHVHLLI